MRKVNPDVLRDDYLRLDGQLAKVAELHNVNPWTVWDNLKRHHPDVLRRGFKGRLKPDTEQLKKWYWDEQKSLNAIADICGTTAARVLMWLRQNDIPTRSRASENARLFTTPGAREPSKEELIQKYVNEKKPMTVVARECNSTRGLVEKALTRHGIPKRPRFAEQVANGDVAVQWMFQNGTIDMWDGTQLLYQSSYEKRFLELANEDRLSVNRWIKRDSIQYDFEGKRRQYYPDFVVSHGQREFVVEVKAVGAFGHSRTRQKLHAGFSFCEEHGFRFVVLTEHHLGIPDSHARQSRTKLHEWVETVERAGDEPFLKFLQQLEESYNSPTKPRLSEWLFGDEDVR